MTCVGSTSMRSSNVGAGTNSRTPTLDGIRVAVVDTKLWTRLLRPRLEAGKPPLSSSFDAHGPVAPVLDYYFANAALCVAE